MWKALVAGAALLAVVGTSLVYAQQRDDRAQRGGRGDRVERGLSPEDRAAFTDARIAALKAGLRLSPDQEKFWPNFEAALREIAQARQEQRAERREGREGRRDDASESRDPVAELRRQADRLTSAGVRLARLADAQGPLYESLDDAQKNRFQLLARILSSRMPVYAQERGWRHHEMRRHHHRHHEDGYRRRGGGRGDDDRNRGMGTGEQL